MDCPGCSATLALETHEGASMYACATCSGTAVTVAVLRRFAPPEQVRAVWNAVWSGTGNGLRKCPWCTNRMRYVLLPGHAEVCCAMPRADVVARPCCRHHIG